MKTNVTKLFVFQTLKVEMISVKSSGIEMDEKLSRR